jgi:hypothetical protein
MTLCHMACGTVDLDYFVSPVLAILLSGDFGEGFEKY